MEAIPESEIGDGTAETAEDLPSDFFDEFNKEEFIEGLSIIDSWDDSGTIQKKNDKSKCDGDKNTVRARRYDESSRSPISNRLDEFIKPGSRRDPNKTNEAIKKDKEVKVKEFLAKSLEDDLRPPGTELDGYFEEVKPPKREKTPVKNIPAALRPRSRSHERRPRYSPAKNFQRTRESPIKNVHRPRWSPRRSPRRSPRPYSPPRQRFNWRQKSPIFFRDRKMKRNSPPFRRSPRRVSPRRSPRRSSPRRSPRRMRRSRSRSPYKHTFETHRSRSPIKHPDRFLYPAASDLPRNYALSPARVAPYQVQGSYPGPVPGEYPGTPGYSYTTSYAGGYNNSNPYDYGQTVVPAGIPLPQAVPGPVMNPVLGNIPNPVPAPALNIPTNPVPLMVPAPMVSPTPNLTSVPHNADSKTPYDALAKLVAEGKISKADYLKLTPNKGANSSLDNNHRVMVLQRCSQALTRLGKLHLPNHLVMNNNMMNAHIDSKYIAPKFCSPLKRQAPIEFPFTKANVDATAQQNKNLVDSIMASLPELEKLISRPKKKTQKNMKDAAVQTSKPYCDVCEIRENTQFNEVSTSIDPDHFCSTIHTQVVEQDLINSKSVFNPSGSVADTATMSIAHLTPAQLVSQLAARAKTLKQPDHPSSSQYQRNSSNNYDYDGRSNQQYQSYNNYRY